MCRVQVWAGGRGGWWQPPFRVVILVKDRQVRQWKTACVGGYAIVKGVARVRVHVCVVFQTLFS